MNAKRRTALVSLCLAGLLCTAVALWEVEDTATKDETATTAVDESAPPNIVLLVVDTLRADALNLNGHPLPTDDELQPWAKQGAQFQQAYAQSSWTRPSFASFLTSQYPRATGITQEKRHVLPEALTTLAETMSNAGYRTIGITSNPNINATFQFDQGFDVYANSGVRFDWMKAENQPDARVASKDVPLQRAPEVFHNALQLVEKHATSGQPTYLQVVIMDVHESHSGPNASALQAQFEHPDKRYLASVRYAAQETDAFLTALAKLPNWANTIVAITSDHGQGLRSHPHVKLGKWHGYVAYESQTHVPLILTEFNTNRIPNNVNIPTQVRMLDLMPTLLDLADVPPISKLEGRSLVPLLHGKPLELPEQLFVETAFRGRHSVAIYADDFIYVENRQRHPGLLPRELHQRGGVQDGFYSNLLNDYPERGAALQKLLQAFEAAHPPRPPEVIQSQVSDAEIEQLRALGYIE